MAGSAWTNQPLLAALVIIEAADGSGLFIYSGTPAYGNLIASITAQAGTDGYGNRYQALITAYNPATGAVAQLDDGQLALGLASDYEEAVIAAASGDMIFVSGSATSMDVPAGLQMLSKAASGSLGFPVLAAGCGATWGNAYGRTALYLASGDETGATDPPAVNALLGAGYNVQAVGALFTDVPLAMTTTTGQMLDLTSASVTAVEAFTGTYMIEITENDCTVRQPYLIGPGVDNATMFSGVGFTGCQRSYIDRPYGNFIPGWVVEGVSTSTTFIADSYIVNPVGRNCAGGIHLSSEADAHNRGECWVTGPDMQEMGATEGGLPQTGLDVFLFSAIQDVQGTGFNSGFSPSASSPGIALHLVGNCGAMDFFGLDIGPATAASVSLQLDADSSGSPNNIDFYGYEAGQAVINGSSHRIKFHGGRVGNSATHGMTVNTTGFGILLHGLTFYDNGQGATGTNYDLNWAGSAKGLVEGCTFENPPVATGTAGVQNNVAIDTVGQGVIFDGNSIPDTASAFTNQPAYVNTPVTQGVATLAAGAVTVTVPLLSAQSKITLSSLAIGGTPGAVYVSARTSGASFVIHSTSATDTSQISWSIAT
jgi:hypothetical protein